MYPVWVEPVLTSSIVLAGGKGLRLGRYKASIEFNGESLIQRVVSRLSYLGGEVIIVIAEGQQTPKLDAYPETRVVTDVYSGRGPLVGIYTGLLNSKSDYNLVAACDMPLLDRHLLDYMIKEANGFDVTIPRLGNMLEPLHAVYSKNCIQAIERLLGEDSFKIDRLLDLVKVRYVEREEIDGFDRQHLSFFNINTAQDLDKARRLAGKTV
ncbi:molybdenum cofactor guanylyltransferase [Chloroflexota bacterium]